MKYKLNDLTKCITKGTTPTTIGFKYTENGVNFIKSECLVNKPKLDLSSLFFINESCNEKMKRSKLEENDILISIAGAYLGKTGIVSKDILPANTNQAVGIIRCNDDINYKYIYYWLSCDKTNQIINSYNSQSAQPNINLTQLGLLEIDLPNLETQQHIVDTIGSVDNLIEKYEEIINKNLKFIKTEFDIMCTQNTTKKLLKDMCKRAVCGTTPSTKNPELWNGKIPFITTPDMSNSVFIFNTERYVAKSDKIINRLIDSNSISISCIGTIGVIGMATEKSLTNQQINTVIPFDNEIFYLYNLLDKNTEKIKSMATGSATPNISKEEFLKLELDKCDDKNIYEFNSIASNIYENIKKLEKKIILLKKEKDLLLKKYFG